MEETHPAGVTHSSALRGQKRPHVGRFLGPPGQFCARLRGGREPQGHRAAPWTRPARPGAHGRRGDALVGTAGRPLGSGLSQASRRPGPPSAAAHHLTCRAAGVGPATVAVTTERLCRGRSHSRAVGLGHACGRRSGPGHGGAGARQTWTGRALTWPVLGDQQRWPGGEEVVLGSPRLLSWGSHLSPARRARPSLQPLPGAF